MIDIKTHGSPIEEDDFKKFSSQIGYFFPDEYFLFLKDNNGGYLDNYVAEYQGLNKLKSKFILAGFYGLGIDSNNDLRSKYELYNGRVPEGCVPIGYDVGGNQVCINLTTKNYGFIYFWDHENELEEDNSIESLYYIASSFNEFLNSIKEDSDDEEPPTDYKVKKTWIDPDFLKSLQQD